MSTHTIFMEVIMAVPPLAIWFSYLVSNFILSAMTNKRTLMVESYEELTRLRSDHPSCSEFLQVKTLNLQEVHQKSV